MPSSVHRNFVCVSHFPTCATRLHPHILVNLISVTEFAKFYRLGKLILCNFLHAMNNFQAKIAH
jgi:hypothetical protein